MTQPSTRTVPFQDPRNNLSRSLVGVIILAVLALLLMLFNWDEVTLNLLAWGMDVPLGLAFLLLYVLGLATGRMIPERQESARASRVRVVTRNDAG